MNPESGTPQQRVDGNATVLYFERDQPVGQREQYCCGYSHSNGTRVSAYWPNTAYFCPVCGEVWAREVLIHHFSYSPIPPNSWVVETRRCAEHGDGYLLVGKEAHLQFCSAQLLAREALLLCLRNPK